MDAANAPQAATYAATTIPASSFRHIFRAPSRRAGRSLGLYRHRPEPPATIARHGKENVAMADREVGAAAAYGKAAARLFALALGLIAFAGQAAAQVTTPAAGTPLR